MSEFFLELFSEEIPPKLQTNARRQLFLDLKKYFEENNIKIKGSKSAFSTPNRIAINFSNISKEIIKKSQEVKGPSLDAKTEALDGFLKSYNIKKSQHGDLIYFRKSNYPWYADIVASGSWI